MLSHYDCIMNDALKPVTQSQLRLAEEASGNALDACTAQWFMGTWACFSTWHGLLSVVQQASQRDVGSVLRPRDKGTMERGTLRQAQHATSDQACRPLSAPVRYQKRTCMCTFCMSDSGRLQVHLPPRTAGSLPALLANLPMPALLRPTLFCSWPLALRFICTFWPLPWLDSGVDLRAVH